MFPTESQGAVQVVSPSVAIVEGSAEKLLNTVVGKPADGQPMFVLDMSDVPMVDSVGLEALLDIQDALRERGGTMKLAGMSQLCADIFRVTGIAERIETYHDAKEAVRSFVR